ncbi:MAG TPA: glycoside hydrolase family 15 protein, partial [Polyangiales bacterium]
FCWIRDASITLYALLVAGYTEEAEAWREWMLRAIAGAPAEAQVIYSVSGERRLTEFELPWLPGYAGSRPVRIGNAAHTQRQLDVFGELMDAMYQCRQSGLENAASWALEKKLLVYLEQLWSEPDEGIWEVRGQRRHFTHSKVMAWVAFDRAIRSIERFGRVGPLDRWRAVRDRIHADVCSKGFSSARGAFTQSYGCEELDANLLIMPLAGFLPADDPRVRATVSAIERELVIEDTFVMRYRTRPELDGLPKGEGTFLPCSFWLVNNMVMQGRKQEARALFERLLALANDVGLLAEEYDPAARRLLGNFPQAFSHLALVDAAVSLSNECCMPTGERTLMAQR